MKQFLLALAILLPLSAMAQRPDIRRNQVGNYPQQEKVVVVEGTNAVNKLRITTPSGKVLKAKGVRKAVSPLSQKTRYVVNLGELTTPGDYRITLGDEQCVLHVNERPYRDIATASLRLFYLIRSGVAIDDARLFEPYQQDYPGFSAQAAAMAERAYQWAKEHPKAFYMQHTLKDPAVSTGAYGDQLYDYCDNAIKGVEESSFQSPYGNKPKDFGWGCLAEFCCCQAMALLFSDNMQSNTKYRRYALQNADYLLGRNATGYCFVTGFGDKSPMHPHHRPSEADGIQAPYPGMLVGGPNPGQQDKKSLGAVVYPSNVPDESYIDTTESYASNEIAINWNASLVAFLCWLDALSGQLTVQ